GLPQQVLPLVCRAQPPCVPQSARVGALTHTQAGCREQLHMAVPAGYPPFMLGKPRFGQNTFYGRFRHFLDMIDPRTLFVTESRLKEAIQLLEDYKHGTLPPGITNRDILLG
ncbi:hypothetical protein FKM82_019584, partial [Ascaphus truei]